MRTMKEEKKKKKRRGNYTIVDDPRAAIKRARTGERRRRGPLLDLRGVRGRGGCRGVETWRRASRRPDWRGPHAR